MGKKQWTTTSKKIVKNLDLWKQVYDLYDPTTCKMQKVKAHSGNTGNEEADRLAGQTLK